MSLGTDTYVVTKFALPDFLWGTESKSSSLGYLGKHEIRRLVLLTFFVR